LRTIPIIDLFAGPGGLNEGFSQIGEREGRPVFEAIASFEMERSACSTLQLRSTYRHLLRSGSDLSPYYRFLRNEIDLNDFLRYPGVQEAFDTAGREVHQIELGPDTRTQSDDVIQAALRGHGISGTNDPWVLIGGPPCQAYSLAGRSRRANDATFADDKKHFLYREYLHIIQRFKPPVFVMENVKGLLSSTNSGTAMFDLIKSDLENPTDGLRYDIHSLTVPGSTGDLRPKDFIIRAEEFGIPQKRHRVILFGVRRDAGTHLAHVPKLIPGETITVRDALSGMPRLRSAISKTPVDDPERWRAVRRSARSEHGATNSLDSDEGHLTRGGKYVATPTSFSSKSAYTQWTVDPRLSGVAQHETRTHMESDLVRYWYAADVASRSGISPKLRNLPTSLLPNHRNASSEARPFDDRFRVQVWDQPATTIVSHISKDGHYYIHPDPDQMRSLTVREAARLQSFPDNYYFMGNRTQQYHQVGNAVPPLLAHQIASVVANAFGWLQTDAGGAAA
jgi:DNA (cytosine-5)-methyltransferase 1